MRRIAFILLVIFLLVLPVNAMEFNAPEAPESAQRLMPDEAQNFGEGLWFVIASAFKTIRPGMLEAVKTCISLIAASLLVGILSNLAESAKSAVTMTGTVTVGMIMFQPVNTLIKLGAETVEQISQYGKLLLPVMTGALAAQGGVSKAGAIYVATAFFDALISSAVAQLLVPMVYIFLCISIVCKLFRQPLLEELRRFLKWLTTWGLKTVLYVFTGYISITGVVGGTTDAAMLKATKLTISGMVPVVGSILSDASEAVLVSAGIVKSAVGVYGLLAVVALWIGPFMKIGIQYLLLKLTAGICEMFGPKAMAGLVKEFSTSMGLILAMTGTVCLVFMISIICFMKGVS